MSKFRLFKALRRFLGGFRARGQVQPMTYERRKEERQSRADLMAQIKARVRISVGGEQWDRMVAEQEAELDAMPPYTGPPEELFSNMLKRRRSTHLGMLLGAMIPMSREERARVKAECDQQHENTEYESDVIALSREFRAEVQVTANLIKRVNALEKKWIDQRGDSKCLDDIYSVINDRAVNATDNHDYDIRAVKERLEKEERITSSLIARIEGVERSD